MPEAMLNSSPLSFSATLNAARFASMEIASKMWSTGALAPKSQATLNRLAEKLSEKQNIQLSVVSGWLRCRLSFALLRTTLLCVRATRRKKVAIDNNIELAVAATRMDY